MSWELAGATILEVVPPTRESGEEGFSKRMKRVEKLLSDGQFDAVNVPEIHDEENRDSRGERKHKFSTRVDSRVFGCKIREEFGLPIIVNHVVAHDPLDRQILWLHETVREYGIHDLVLVGAPHDRHPWPGPTVSEANEAFKAEFPDSQLRLGNICIPGRPGSPIPESERMAAKISAGADFFTTQILFSLSEITELWREFEATRPELLATPLLISLCPVRKAENLAFLRYLGVHVPEEVESALKSADPAECLEQSLQILCRLQEQMIETARNFDHLASPGWNIAPVGSIPGAAVLDLIRRLPASLSR